jgi:hypothetical protein
MATLLTPQDKLNSLEVIVGYIDFVKIEVANRSYKDWPLGCILKPVEKGQQNQVFNVETVDNLPAFPKGSTSKFLIPVNVSENAMSSN